MLATFLFPSSTVNFNWGIPLVFQDCQLPLVAWCTSVFRLHWFYVVFIFASFLSLQHLVVCSFAVQLPLQATVPPIQNGSAPRFGVE